MCLNEMESPSVLLLHASAELQRLLKRTNVDLTWEFQHTNKHIFLEWHDFPVWFTLIQTLADACLKGDSLCDSDCRETDDRLSPINTFGLKFVPNRDFSVHGKQTRKHRFQYNCQGNCGVLPGNKSLPLWCRWTPVFNWPSVSFPLKHTNCETVFTGIWNLADTLWQHFV